MQLLNKFCERLSTLANFTGLLALIAMLAFPAFGQALLPADSSSFLPGQIRFQLQPENSQLPDSSRWVPVNAADFPLVFPQASSVLWLQIRFPRPDFADAALLFNKIKYHLTVYDSAFVKIYFSDQHRRIWIGPVFESQRWHMVPLQMPVESYTFYARIDRIGGPDPGIGAMPVLIAEDRFLKHLFHLDLAHVILGKIFGFIALLALFIGMRRRGRVKRSTLAFSMFVFCVGLFLLSNTELKQLIIDIPALWYFVGIIGFYYFPVGINAFIEQVIGPGYLRLIRYIWVFHLIYATLMFIQDILGVFDYGGPPESYRYILLVEMALSFAAVGKGKSHSPLLTTLLWIGMGSVGVTGVIDLLHGLGIIAADAFYFHWGVLVLILCMGILLENQFTTHNRNLNRYSHELQQKSVDLRRSNRRLEKYNEILGQMVGDRTNELNERNEALNTAVAQLKEANNQLVIREKMASLGTLVAGVAHEVNTPIGAVNSASDVNRRCLEKIYGLLGDRNGTLAGESILSRFDRLLCILETNNALVLNAGERVAHIVRSLRDFARLDRADLKKANVNELLESTLTLVHHELKHRIEVFKEFQELPRIKCFPNQLNQVFVNLLVNAVQAIEGKGRIVIRTEVLEKQVIVTISDSGKGIKPADLEKIFDPGFTTKGVGVGTGLGLSISYNIVQKHGGGISVDSKPGEGTTFKLNLPIDHEPVDA